MAKTRWSATYKADGLGNVSYTIDANTVLGNIQKLASGFRRGSSKIEKALEPIAQMGENYAKSNHRWQNRTGDAEAGLTGAVGWDTDTDLVIAFYHTVDYGVYLELGFQKRYAILEETAQYVSQHLGQALKGGVDVVLYE